MQIINSNSPNFTKLIVSQDAKENLKKSNLTRGELEILKNSKKILDDTKYYDVVLYDKDDFQLVSPANLYFDSYNDNIFGINKISQSSPNTLKMGISNSKSLCEVVRFPQNGEDRISYVILNKNGGLTESIYNLPLVSKIAKSLDNIAKTFQTNEKVRITKDTINFENESRKINQEIDKLF